MLWELPPFQTEQKENMLNRSRDNDTKLGFAIIGFILVVISIIAYFLVPAKLMDTQPGTVSVAVIRPLFFGKGGVDPVVRQPGREWEWSTTNYINVKSTPYKQQVVIDDFVTADGYRVDFNSQAILQVMDPANLISDWTLAFWENSVAGEYAMIVRKEVKKYELVKVMGDNTTLGLIDEEVTKNLRAFIKERKIPVNIIGVTLGQARPNQKLFDQIEETARVAEEGRTYIKRSEAEKQRKQSETDRALADKAYRDAMNISPAEYVLLQRERIQAEACVKAQQCFFGIERVATSAKK